MKSILHSIITTVLLIAVLISQPITASKHPVSDPPLTGWPYTTVWDSPTLQCSRYGILFNLSEYDIIQNPDDVFDGGKITIFYGIGEFPKIDHQTGQYTNGGIPQSGNLTYHLEKVRNDINSVITNQSFDGLAVIDFEAWRPLFDHNFDSLDIYQKASEELVRKEHPTWNNTQVLDEAKKEFNAAGKLFFLATIETAKSLRPYAHWGYYGFPRCYGIPGNYCSPGSQADNDRLWWLWGASTALYPRIYLGVTTNITTHVLYLMSTVHEAVRLSSNETTKHIAPVYPYSRHTYDGEKGHFYSHEDLWLSHAISSFLGSTGIVIWGSSSSMETNELCSSLRNYTSEEFGPFVKNFTVWTQECSKTQCSNHGQCVTTEIPQLTQLLKSFDSNLIGQIEKWQEYFIGLIVHIMEGYSLNGSFSCKCYEGWSGQECSSPSTLTNKL